MNSRIIGTIVLLLLAFQTVMYASPKPVVAQALPPFIKDPPYGTSPRYGGTLVIATSSDPRTVWGLLAGEAMSQYVVCQMFEGLLEFDYTGNKFMPVLAQSWEMSSDGRQFTFHLIRNATWHDGVPFTSADVKFSVENIIYPKETGAYPRAKEGLTSPGGKFVTVQAPDNFTVIFSWPDPYPTFLPYATTMIMQWVLPKHVFEGVAAADIPAFAAKTNPVGLGPFKFKEWVKGDHITLVRNDHYWRRGEPYLDSIVFRIIPDDTAKMIAYSTGEVDLIYPTNVNLKEFARIKNQLPAFNSNYNGESGAGGAYVLHLNEKSPILTKKEVRQAIAYAINKTEIQASVLMGLVATTDNFILSTRTWAYNPDIPKYMYDPKKAEAMLDAAGYPRGKDGIRFKLVVKAYPGNSLWYDTSTIIASQLRKIGIDATISAVEYAVYVDQVFVKLNYDLAISGIADGPDPGWLRAYLTSWRIGKGMGSNCMAYNNSRVDQLFTLYGSEPDYNKRVQYLFEMQKIALDEVAVIPLYERRSIFVVRATFGGWFPSSLNGFYYSNLHNVWWEPASLASASTTVTTPVSPAFPYEWIAAIAFVVVLAIGALVYTRQKRKHWSPKHFCFITKSRAFTLGERITDDETIHPEIQITRDGS